MKLGMFDKANYQPEKIIRGNASIPLKQAGFLCVLGVLAGGPVFLFCFLAFLIKAESVDAPPLFVYIAGMIIGMFLFFLGLFLPSIVCISKELILIKDNLCEECKSNLEMSKQEDTKSNKALNTDV